MKKIITPLVITTIAIVVAGLLLLKSFSAKADVSPKITCDGQVGGLEYICTNESSEKCTYVDGDLNGHTMCYGKFYLSR